MDDFEIFATAPPGLEPMLLPEFRALGYQDARYGPGGVTMQGNWCDVWRLNLELRGATKVLARIGSFRAMSLAGLDHRADEFQWGDLLRPGTTVRVDVSCKRSKIYHAGAAAERIGKALRKYGMAPSAEGQVTLKVRIEQNIVTLSLDTSGESLHRRGHKLAVGKAPIRETMAALLLRACGFTGDEPVVDPMCGSGTFVIEAAEITAGLQPGRDRSFAFETLASFDQDAVAALRRPGDGHAPRRLFHGSDRDAGAIRMSTENAARAGVADWCAFNCHPAGDVRPPDGPPGLVIVNPPYGGRVSNKKQLFALHASLGTTLKAHFRGWRLGLVTSEPGLAKATGLTMRQGSPLPHGGLTVYLFQSDL